MYNKKPSLTQYLLVASCLSLAACNDDSTQKIETPEAPNVVLTNSDIDFSNCREIAGGITVSKAALQQQITGNVTVNSLTDMGFVFEGSDDLGMLVIRSLSCEAISVTDSEGNVNTDENVTIAHVGTPINVSNLPATTYSNDGINAADFNNYTLSYQTSSPAYFDAMKNAGLQNASLNEGIVNELIDLDPEQCSTSSLFVNVPGDSEFAFSITGEVVEATAECHPGGVNFVANWWSVDSDNQVTALSNEIFDQTFTATAGENVFVITTKGTEINKMIGATSSRFTGFSGSGYIPAGGLGDVNMVAEALGTLVN
ncbi:hypothetical protein ACFL6Z_05150 [Pseudomonadota bacterium]